MDYDRMNHISILYSILYCIHENSEFEIQYGLWIFHGFKIHMDHGFLMDYGFFMELKFICIMDSSWI